MEKKFAEGIWGYSPQKGTKGSCSQAQVWVDGLNMAVVESTDNEDEATANALLMSKAPELLDILKRLCDKLDQVELSDDATEEIVPIIAEADEIMLAATTLKQKTNNQ